MRHNCVLIDAQLTQYAKDLALNISSGDRECSFEVGIVYWGVVCAILSFFSLLYWSMCTDSKLVTPDFKRRREYFGAAGFVVQNRPRCLRTSIASLDRMIA